MFGAERLLSAYRRAGADPPSGDLRGHHGVPMEGYFWRLTDVASGTVVVAFTGVSRDAAGATWATVGLAGHPDGVVRTAVAEHAEADPRRLGVRVGSLLRADEDGLEVDLGPGARLRATFAERVGWPRRLGGAGVAHLIPGLTQYWHPHMLDARVTAAVELGGRRMTLDGARGYAEKNWTPYARGFPSSWWWGQAHGFARDDVCVAFAGGRVFGVGAGAVVVRIGDELVHAVAPPALLRTRLGDGRWSLRARTARHDVVIAGRADGAPFRFPVPVPRERRAAEGVSAMHLAGHIHLEVRGRCAFAGSSRLAGLERGRGG